MRNAVFEIEEDECRMVMSIYRTEGKDRIVTTTTVDKVHASVELKIVAQCCWNGLIKASNKILQ